MEAWVRFISERMQDLSWRNELMALDSRHLQVNLNIEKISRDWAHTLTQALIGDI